MNLVINAVDTRGNKIKSVAYLPDRGNCKKCLCRDYGVRVAYATPEKCILFLCFKCLVKYVWRFRNSYNKENKKTGGKK